MFHTLRNSRDLHRPSHERNEWKPSDSSARLDTLRIIFANALSVPALLCLLTSHPGSYFSSTESYTPSVYGNSLETMVGKAEDDAIGGGDRGHFPVDTGTLRIWPKESVAPQWEDVNDLAPTEVGTKNHFDSQS